MADTAVLRFELPDGTAAGALPLGPDGVGQNAYSRAIRLRINTVAGNYLWHQQQEHGERSVCTRGRARRTARAT